MSAENGLFWWKFFAEGHVKPLIQQIVEITSRVPLSGK
jgi:hypothetical protein